jgi:hypothetical protein
VIRGLVVDEHRGVLAGLAGPIDAAEDMQVVGLATRLGTRDDTVTAHLGHAFQRIGVTDRTSAALWARTHLLDRKT